MKILIRGLLITITVICIIYISGVLTSIEIDGKRLASNTQHILTTIFLITASIHTFDKRLIQARQHQEIPLDEPMLPSWLGITNIWVHYCIIATLLLTGWKYAIIILVAGFILAVLPVLETIGNILTAPFKKN